MAYRRVGAGYAPRPRFRSAFLVAGFIILSVAGLFSAPHAHGQTARLADVRPIALIGATDQNRAIRFYRDTLGLELRGERPYGAVFLAGGVEFKIQEVKRFRAQEWPVFGWGPRDFDAVVDAVLARGVAVVAHPALKADRRGVWQDADGWRKIWIRDPDGNVLEIVGLPSSG